MTTLTVNDLLIIEELEPTLMKAIQGGRIKLPRLEPTPVNDGQNGTPAENNLPPIWNDGITGPVIIWNRG